jgi:hypothetical protein
VTDFHEGPTETHTVAESGKSIKTIDYKKQSPDLKDALI